ncbi:hypothetical protein I030019A5_12320 [Bifidobacterium bifidum]
MVMVMLVWPMTAVLASSGMFARAVIQVAGSAPETLNARGGSVRQAHPKGGTMRHPAKREPSGGESRVRLGAGLGNEAMQMTSL